MADLRLEMAVGHAAVERRRRGIMVTGLAAIAMCCAGVWGASAMRGSGAREELLSNSWKALDSPLPLAVSDNTMRSAKLSLKEQETALSKKLYAALRSESKVGGSARTQSLARLESKARSMSTGFDALTGEAGREQMLSSGFTAHVPMFAGAQRGVHSSVVLHVEGSNSKEPINVNFYMQKASAMSSPARQRPTDEARLLNALKQKEEELRVKSREIEKLIQKRHTTTTLSTSPGYLESLAEARGGPSVANGVDGVGNSAIQREIKNTVLAVSRNLGEQPPVMVDEDADHARMIALASTKAVAHTSAAGASSTVLSSVAKVSHEVAGEKEKTIEDAADKPKEKLKTIEHAADKPKEKEKTIEHAADKPKSALQLVMEAAERRSEAHRDAVEAAREARDKQLEAYEASRKAIPETSLARLQDKMQNDMQDDQATLHKEVSLKGDSREQLAPSMLNRKEHDFLRSLAKAAGETKVSITGSLGDFLNAKEAKALQSDNEVNLLSHPNAGDKAQVSQSTDDSIFSSGATSAEGAAIHADKDMLAGLEQAAGEGGAVLKSKLPLTLPSKSIFGDTGEKEMGSRAHSYDHGESEAESWNREEEDLAQQDAKFETSLGGMMQRANVERGEYRKLNSPSTWLHA